MDGIPNVVTEAVTAVVAIFSLISAIVPDRSIPTWLSALVNFLALNIGNARNDPAQSAPRVEIRGA